MFYGVSQDPHRGHSIFDCKPVTGGLNNVQ
jgi:hypothetical protein